MVRVRVVLRLRLGTVQTRQLAVVLVNTKVALSEVHGALKCAQVDCSLGSGLGLEQLLSVDQGWG